MTPTALFKLIWKALEGMSAKNGIEIAGYIAFTTMLALFPFLVGALSNSTSLANAIAIFAVAAYAVFFMAAYALPETRGRVLHAET